MESPSADCLLFDTTNYYTFMASHTESEIACRGKNKVGRHSLRQIGLGLLVSRQSRLLLHYSVYPGNLHDSRQFEAVMDDMKRFHSILSFQKGSRLPSRLETPSKTQAEFPPAFGAQVDESGVLQLVMR